MNAAAIQREKRECFQQTREVLNIAAPNNPTPLQRGKNNRDRHSHRRSLTRKRRHGSAGELPDQQRDRRR